MRRARCALRSASPCAHVLGTLFGVQFLHDGVQDFPAGIKNPNVRRKHFQPKLDPKSGRPVEHTIMHLFFPLYTWQDVLHCLTTSPKTFMPAELCGPAPGRVKVVSAALQAKQAGKRRGNKHASPAAKRARRAKNAAKNVDDNAGGNGDSDDDGDNAGIDEETDENANAAVGRRRRVAAARAAAVPRVDAQASARVRPAARASVSASARAPVRSASSASALVATPVAAAVASNSGRSQRNRRQPARLND